MYGQLCCCLIFIGVTGKHESQVGSVNISRSQRWATAERVNKVGLISRLETPWRSLATISIFATVFITPLHIMCSFRAIFLSLQRPTSHSISSKEGCMQQTDNNNFLKATERPCIRYLSVYDQSIPEGSTLRCASVGHRLTSGSNLQAFHRLGE